MCCCLVVELVCSHSCWTISHNKLVCGCVGVFVCEREREKVSVGLCVCACVCGGDKERGRKDSMEERDVATETGGGGGGGRGTCQRHQSIGPPDTLMLGMDSQTIVCLIILCLLHMYIS